MTKEEIGALARHITEARQKGKEAADAVEDGGTCNLDRVCLYLPGTQLRSLKGVDCYRLQCYIALRASFGQANKNTRGVEAMAKHLNDAGYQAFVWYQMD